MKFAIIHFWHQFDYRNNCYKDKFFNGWEQTDDYENADVVLIGSFSFVYGQSDCIRNIKGKKILFITEPLYVGDYRQMIREGLFDVVFGCVEHDPQNNKYKFPLGFFYFYSFDKSKLSMLNEANEYIKTCELPKEFCCLINSHDNTNVRTPVYNALKQLGHITCPGRLYNNCSNEEVNRIGKNDYLKKFKFNICSENTLDYPGYITEKIWDSFFYRFIFTIIVCKYFSIMEGFFTYWR